MMERDKNPNSECPMIHMTGNTEILDAFREFTKRHPEAQKYESLFNPTPWTELGARSFVHIDNNNLPALFERWKEQLKIILKNVETPTT